MKTRSYDRPLGLCDCPNAELTRSYHFTCSYPVPKPFGETFMTLFGAKPCLLRLNLLWQRIASKGLLIALTRPNSLFRDLVLHPDVEMA